MFKGARKDNESIVYALKESHLADHDIVLHIITINSQRAFCDAIL